VLGMQQRGWWNQQGWHEHCQSSGKGILVRMNATLHPSDYTWPAGIEETRPM